MFERILVPLDGSAIAADALASKPAGAPCWFWFGYTPAPIALADTVPKLVERWVDWRRAYEGGGPAIMDRIWTWALK